MKKQYIIKCLIRNEYFYGFYTNKYWTNKISEAKTFTSLEETEQYLTLDEFNFGMFEIKTIYC